MKSARNTMFRGVRRPTPCMHKCTRPVPSTLFLRFHPFKEGWEVRRCPECKKDSAYSSTEDEE